MSHYKAESGSLSTRKGSATSKARSSKTFAKDSNASPRLATKDIRVPETEFGYIPTLQQYGNVTSLSPNSKKIFSKFVRQAAKREVGYKDMEAKLHLLKGQKHTVTTEEDAFNVYEDNLMNHHMKGNNKYRNVWPSLVLKKDFANQLQHKICKEFIARNYDHLYKVEHTLEEKIQLARSRIDTGLDQASRSRSGSRPRSASPNNSLEKRKRSIDSEVKRASFDNSQGSLHIRHISKQSIDIIDHHNTSFSPDHSLEALSAGYHPGTFDNGAGQINFHGHSTKHLKQPKKNTMKRAKKSKARRAFAKNAMKLEQKMMYAQTDGFDEARKSAEMRPEIRIKEYADARSQKKLQAVKKSDSRRSLNNLRSAQSPHESLTSVQ